MADALSSDHPASVKVADAGPSRKKLSIEIPAQAVSAKLRESLDTLTVEAHLPGFRKGRAPRRLVEKRFGDSVKGEAKQQLVASAYSKAVEDHKLRVVGDPIADGLDKIDLVDGKPLAFEIEVEVMPEFELPKLEGITIRKPLVKVADERVDEEIRRMCVNEGTLEERQAAEPGDYITGHGVMRGDADATVFYDIDGCVVQAPDKSKDGRGMILGVEVEDFQKQLGLPKPGDKKIIKTKGPANHEVEAIRGQNLTVEFTVTRVDRIIPMPVDDLVKGTGFESLDKLKDAVRHRLHSLAVVEQTSAMRGQVARYLLDHVTMEVPQRLSDRQAQRLLDRRRVELMYRGFDPQQVEEQVARLRGASHEAATRELKLFFILARAAEQLGIRVTEAEVNARIAQIAASRGVRPEKLMNEIRQQGRFGSFFQQLVEHKTMDAVLAKADVNEMTAEEFNAFVKEQEKAEPGKA